ncbi:hypothetical protein AB3N59_08520 [Leptospira sp. WS92.C1]
MGKLTVRCPRCYESFLFDPDSIHQYGSARFESDPKQESPYRKSSLELIWNKLKSIILNFRQRFGELGTLGGTPGKRLAKNLLLILLAIGIVRTCFFPPFNENIPDSKNSRELPEIVPEEQPLEPSNPVQPEETVPRFQI